MSDLEEARRLLKAAEAKEIRAYGSVGPILGIQLSAGWVAIANAAIDGVVWGGKNEV